jgi:hypothetical protein
VGGVCYLSMGMVVLLMGLAFASVYIYRYFFLAQVRSQRARVGKMGLERSLRPMWEQGRARGWALGREAAGSPDYVLRLEPVPRLVPTSAPCPGERSIDPGGNTRASPTVSSWGIVTRNSGPAVIRALERFFCVILF